MNEMKKIGFLISDKENEKRRAITPKDLKEFHLTKYIYVETGYGNSIGILDSEYIETGVNVVNKTTIYSECDVICDPKIGDAMYLENLPESKILFGWIHAVQNKSLTQMLVEKKHTVIAWEEMFDDLKHSFYKNNIIAGEASVLHAITSTGLYPFNKKAAIIGDGNTSKGAQNIFNKLGINFDIYTRENSDKLSSKLSNYDIIANAILWDTNNPVRIITREDLKKMKKNSIIIDISCDKNGAIETSTPTSINKPIYYIDDIAHYSVDHTPSLFPVEVSKVLSEVVKEYLSKLIYNQIYTNITLKNAIIIDNGTIIDSKIIKYQK